MTISNITISQDFITEQDRSINATLDDEFFSVLIDDYENYYHKLIRKTVLDEGSQCCDNEETYNKILLMANKYPVVFSDPV